MHELLCVQLSIFLLATCHVVLIIQDYIIDWNLLKLIRTGLMLRKRFPELSSLSSNIINSESTEILNDTSPDLVFVFNKTLETNYMAIEHQNLELAIKNFFEYSKLQNEESPKIHTVFLPYFEPEPDNPLKSSETFERHILELRYKLLGMKCKTFTKTITEKEWLRNAVRFWEILRKSNLILEYVKSATSV